MHFLSCPSLCSEHGTLPLFPWPELFRIVELHSETVKFSFVTLLFFRLLNLQFTSIEAEPKEAFFSWRHKIHARKPLGHRNPFGLHGLTAAMPNFGTLRTRSCFFTPRSRGRGVAGRKKKNEKTRQEHVLQIRLEGETRKKKFFLTRKSPLNSLAAVILMLLGKGRH